jgi:hypothetical protein
MDVDGCCPPDKFTIDNAGIQNLILINHRKSAAATLLKIILCMVHKGLGVSGMLYLEHQYLLGCQIIFSDIPVN